MTKRVKKEEKKGRVPNYFLLLHFQKKKKKTADKQTSR